MPRFYQARGLPMAASPSASPLIRNFVAFRFNYHRMLMHPFQHEAIPIILYATNHIILPADKASTLLVRMEFLMFLPIKNIISSYGCILKFLMGFGIPLRYENNRPSIIFKPCQKGCRTAP
ncbi:hypothetical protein [Thermoplasma acidophilum]|uniref:Uncharacterized protein n=1 Tax=Thermoplasma acidophilum (strain ATCC 25905 / DSM 1728 / JCM 9062 / NBRC 15155 / AMRC-C165) TaxID=273075 RepID=Q9HLV5_THEAC|nr:hypothetical protein [Thermoplasma acidophilum]